MIELQKPTLTYIDPFDLDFSQTPLQRFDLVGRDLISPSKVQDLWHTVAFLPINVDKCGNVIHSILLFHTYLVVNIPSCESELFT